MGIRHALVFCATMICAACVNAEEPANADTASSLYSEFTKPNTCRLKAPGQMYPKKETFNLLKVCRFDEATQSWERAAPLKTYAGQIEPVSRQVYSRETDQVLVDITDRIGLFWLEWEEDGAVASRLAYCGPMMCEDVMIGPMTKGEMIATCVPRESSAVAQYVRDPKKFCR